MVNQVTSIGGAPLASAGPAPAPAPVRSAPVRISGNDGPAPRPVDQDAAVAQVNHHLQQAQTELKLEVDAGSGRTVFQLVQHGTGELVMQVPSAEILGMSRRMRELEGQGGGSGALVDKEG